jgi:copper chaperone
MATITMKVQGMSCGHCVQAVVGALREVGAQATVNLQEGTVFIQYDEATLYPAVLKEAIETQGYDVIA